MPRKAAVGGWPKMGVRVGGDERACLVERTVKADEGDPCAVEGPREAVLGGGGEPHHSDARQGAQDGALSGLERLGWGMGGFPSRGRTRTRTRTLRPGLPRVANAVPGSTQTRSHLGSGLIEAHGGVANVFVVR